jgi:type VII secretion protein EccE
VGVVLAVRQPVPVLVAVSVGAAVVLALTGVRVGGRWLYELPPLVVAFLSRTRRGVLPTSGGVAGTSLALLETLLPGATVRTVETARGPVMAISHRGGMTAHLMPDTVEALSRLPMPDVLLPAAADHAFGVQLVFHAGTHADTPRRLWVAVHAARTVETPADAELSLALRNALRRVRRALDRAGVPVRPLAETQALSAIAGLAHVTGGRTAVRESWKHWCTGPVSQATFRLAGWERLSDAQARGLVDGMLAGVAGVALTITLGARTERRVHAVLRLAAANDAAVDVAARQLSGWLAASGIRLRRLDGRQAAGVAASLPLGVFLP